MLWVSSTSEDMDIFVTIRNIGPDGKDVCEVGQHGQPIPCVTKGWLRASHRKLDPAEVAAVPAVPRARRALVAEAATKSSNARSRSGRPAWCSRRATSCASTSSRATASGSAPYTHYHADYNAGAVNTVYAGGDTAVVSAAAGDSGEAGALNHHAGQSITRAAIRA